MQKYKIGLALSGGGARGIAHIGVLDALAEANIEADIISGASAGSLVGTMHAAGVPTQKMMELLKSARLWRTLKIRRRGFASQNYLKKQMKKVIPIDSFDALKKPMHIAVVNLLSGELEILHSGQLFDAVAASCSIPIVFHPVVMNGKTYVDGGVIRNLPARDIRDKCEFLIGVDVMPLVDEIPEKLKSFRKIGMRTAMSVVHHNSKPDLEICDFTIVPKDLVHVNMVKLKNIDKTYQIGYDATKAKIGELKQKLKLTSPKPNAG